MFFYKIGYGTCEESSFFEFSSPNKLSREELVNLFLEAAKKTYLELLFERDRVNKEYVQHNTKDAGELTEERPLSWQDIIDSRFFIEALKESKLEPIKYSEKVSVFGWANCIDPDDWAKYLDKEDKQMAIRLAKMLGKKIS